MWAAETMQRIQRSRDGGKTMAVAELLLKSSALKVLASACHDDGRYGCLAVPRVEARSRESLQEVAVLPEPLTRSCSPPVYPPRRGPPRRGW